MHKPIIKVLQVLFLSCFLTPLWADENPAVTPPPLMLANLYRDEIILADYWVSEKLDGVRAYWDGENY